MNLQNLQKESPSALALGVVTMDIIRKIVKNIISSKYEYRYDPDHKNKPSGGNWEKTQEGWSKKQHNSRSRNKSDKEEKNVYKDKKLKGFELGKDKNYKYHVHFSKKKMKEILDKGHFSIISAGPSTEEKKKKLDPSFFIERHEQLKKDLEKQKIPFTECVGHYKDVEMSIMIPHDYYVLDSEEKNFMVHHSENDEKEYENINKLGEKYNQDSVLHGNENKFSIRFTTGKLKNKECSGKGWKEIPMAEDFYTELKLSKEKISKISMDIHECFEKGYL